MKRTCPVCRQTIWLNQPDPCLGKLPGVTEACCGHGEQDAGYISFESGVTVYFDTQAVLDEPSKETVFRPSVIDNDEEET